jgi:hypothetical protein
MRAHVLWRRPAERQHAQAARQRRRGPQQRQRQPATNSGAHGSSLRTPHRYGPMQGVFSCYPHLTSEYDRPSVLARFARLQELSLQVAPEDFVVGCCPLPPTHSPTFAHYNASELPYTVRV